MFGVQFRNIGNADLELKDIIVYRADKSEDDPVARYGDGTTLLWTYDSAHNRYNSQLQFWPDPYTDATKTEKVGHPAWGDEDMVYTNMTIKIGDGMWIKPGIGTNAKKPVMTVAGEVFNPGTDVQYYTWQLLKGKQYQVCNPFPVDIELQDVLVYREDKSTVAERYGDGLTLLWTYDSSKNKPNAQLQFWPDPYTDATKTAKVGYPAWGDEDMVYTNFTINAAQGFWIKPGIGTNAKKPLIRFNNPFYSAE